MNAEVTWLAGSGLNSNDASARHTTTTHDNKLEDAVVGSVSTCLLWVVSFMTITELEKICANYAVKRAIWRAKR